MAHTRLFTLIAATLLLLTITAYSNSFHNSFHFDDSHTIVNNLYLRNIVNIPLFFRDSTTFSSLPTNQTYRPVVTATLAIDYWLGKGLDDTFYFHLSMFSMFLLQGILMYFLYIKVFISADRGNSTALAALIAVGAYLLHPANAETINYIISRSDSYSTLFIVLALVLYIHSSFCRRWQLYLVPVAIGILAKPIAGVFPLLLFVYLFLFEGGVDLAGPTSRNALARLSFALKRSAPAFLFIVCMLIFVKRMDPPTWVAGGTSKFEYLITQPYVILKYFLSFFLPISLSADTDLAPFTSADDSRFIIGSLFLAALLFAAIITSRHQKLRPISFGLLWFFITLAPTSLIPLAEVTNDHRTFLPYVGLMLSAGWSVNLLLVRLRQRFPASRLIPPTAASLIALALAVGCYGTHRRCAVWSTDEFLWLDVIEKNPHNGRGLMNYGLALMGKADYVGAEKYFIKALVERPNYWTLHVNLGILNAATGRYLQAEEYFKKGISLQPEVPETYFFYARFLKERGRYTEAISNLEKAMQLSSAYMDSRYLLMEIYLELGKFDKVAEIAAEMLRLVPGDKRATLLLETIKSGRSKPEIVAAAESSPGTPEYFLNLSLGYYREGSFAKCISAAQRALELRPGYDLAYNNICSAFIELKEWDKAIEAGENALKHNPSNVFASGNLARAKARGRMPFVNVAAKPAGRTAEELLDLSLAFYQSQDYRKSIEAAKLALTKRPDYAAAFNNICAAYNALQQWDRAIAAGERAVQLNPANQLARNNLAWAKKQKAVSERSH